MYDFLQSIFSELNRLRLNTSWGNGCLVDVREATLSSNSVSCHWSSREYRTKLGNVITSQRNEFQVGFGLRQRPQKSACRNVWLKKVNSLVRNADESRVARNPMPSCAAQANCNCLNASYVFDDWEIKSGKEWEGEMTESKVQGCVHSLTHGVFQSGLVSTSILETAFQYACESADSRRL